MRLLPLCTATATCPVLSSWLSWLGRVAGWACLGLALQAGAADRVLRISYAADYPPYCWQGDSGPQGLEIDIANEVLGRRLGWKLVHEILPWSRAQAYVENSQSDAFFAVPTPARLRYAVASRNPVLPWKVAIFVRRGDRRFDHVKTLADLKPYTIGVIAGNGWAKSRLQGYTVESAMRQPLLVRMLLARRFDVVLEDPMVMGALLRGEPEAAQIEELPRGVEQADIHFLLGRAFRDQQLLEQFDREIAQMRNDGTLQRLLANYR